MHPTLPRREKSLMSTRQRHFLQAILVDFLIIFLAYITVYSVRAVNASLDITQAFGEVIVTVVLMLTSMYVFGVYRRLWKQTSGHDVSVILNAVLVATLLLMARGVMLNERPLPLSVTLVANVLALGGFIAVRYRSRLISGVSWRWRAIWYQEFPYTATRILIVGAGESGQAFALRIKHRVNKHNYQIIGFVDDAPEKQNMFIEGCRVLGQCDDIIDIVESYNVDLIVVAIHNISGPAFREILSLCEQTKAMIKVVPDVFAQVRARQGVPLLRDVQPEDLLGRSVVTRHEAVDVSPVSERVILVTGAAGSIGSELSRQILDYQPTTVILLDNNESGLHDLITELQNISRQVELVAALVDITLPERLREIFLRYHPQIVFHAAAYKHVWLMEHHPEEAVRVNVHGTRNVAMLAQEYGVERFVLVSTDKAVEPQGVMGASKRVCELVTHALANKKGNRTLFTAVRFGNVLGSRGSVVPTFNRQIDAGGPITITHPEMKRYFMSIPEAVNLIIHAACLTNGDDIFVLRMGEEVRIIELAERMIRMRGLRPYVDIDIQYTGIRPGEKLHEVLFSERENPVDTAHPNIVRVHTWEDDFNPDLFLRRLDRMYDQVLHNRERALGCFQEAILIYDNAKSLAATGD